VLARGQSLVPLMNMRLARPSLVVDINCIAGLDYVKAENGELVIGALARHIDLLRDRRVRRDCPL
jgi:carbon-monoxide dehydrogenase medium subunit